MLASSCDCRNVQHTLRRLLMVNMLAPANTICTFSTLISMKPAHSQSEKRNDSLVCIRPFMNALCVCPCMLHVRCCTLSKPISEVVNGYHGNCSQLNCGQLRHFKGIWLLQMMWNALGLQTIINQCSDAHICTSQVLCTTCVTHDSTTILDNRWCMFRSNLTAQPKAEEVCWITGVVKFSCVVL